VTCVLWCVLLKGNGSVFFIFLTVIHIIVPYLSIYLSIYWTYIMPLQRHSQPRLGQRGKSWRVYKKNWRGPAAKNGGERGDHSKQRDSLSGGSASKWHHKVTSGGRVERSGSATRALTKNIIIVTVVVIIIIIIRFIIVSFIIINFNISFSSAALLPSSSSSHLHYHHNF